jgi:hypothetical protein
MEFGDDVFGAQPTAAEFGDLALESALKKKDLVDPQTILGEDSSDPAPFVPLKPKPKATPKATPKAKATPKPKASKAKPKAKGGVAKKQGKKKVPYSDDVMERVRTWRACSKERQETLVKKYSQIAITLDNVVAVASALATLGVLDETPVSFASSAMNAPRGLALTIAAQTKRGVFATGEEEVPEDAVDPFA